MKYKKELNDHIIPFWKGLRDNEFGGYYGYMDYDLKLDKRAEKGPLWSPGSVLITMEGCALR